MLTLLPRLAGRNPHCNGGIEVLHNWKDPDRMTPIFHSLGLHRPKASGLHVRDHPVAALSQFTSKHVTGSGHLESGEPAALPLHRSPPSLLVSLTPGACSLTTRLPEAPQGPLTRHLQFT